MNDIVTESPSTTSTPVTDGSSVQPSSAIDDAAAAAAVGPISNGSHGDGDKDRCSKTDCTGRRGRELRWGLDWGEGVA